ncbi:hypothetical protein, partial [Pseudomonas syringae group genomosp. 3]|uniref:hypothetical protein n=1 Tax=Pseudomonas syringae group genomosp. 3 TaxID=251701 RepID=UPI001C3F2803
FNQLVVGSNPTRPTISKIWKAHENEDFRVFFCFADCVSGSLPEPSSRVEATICKADRKPSRLNASSTV